MKPYKCLAEANEVLGSYKGKSCVDFITRASLGHCDCIALQLNIKQMSFILFQLDRIAWFQY